MEPVIRDIAEVAACANDSRVLRDDGLSERGLRYKIQNLPTIQIGAYGTTKVPSFRVRLLPPRLRPIEQ